MSDSEFFAQFEFDPVIVLPPDFEVYDFTRGYDPDRSRQSEYGIGKYGEKRPGMYKGELYQDQRDIHVGIDIAAPVGTPIHAFYQGRIFLLGQNDQPGDYGATLITEHALGDRALYALWGHLSRKSLQTRSIGHEFNKGDVIAWVGDRHENGGWNPHLHFQLSWIRPEKADLPGVVHQRDWSQAQKDYPDPRFVLGALY